MSKPATPRAIFISHGSPALAIEDAPARDFLANFRAVAGRPRAILCISAHWETETPMLGGAPRPETIHDFHGFPRELHRLDYPAPGAPDLAKRAARLLNDAGFPAGIDAARGLDHGAWSPLLLAYPEADVPVVQLSVQPRRDARHHLAVGRALASLLAEDVLVLGSGAVTHNLREFGRYRAHDAAPDYVGEFDAWLERALLAGDEAALLDWENAPHAARNHPSPEHFLPLFAALGAAGAAPKARRLHASISYGILSMAAYAFEPACLTAPNARPN